MLRSQPFQFLASVFLGILCPLFSFAATGTAQERLSRAVDGTFAFEAQFVQKNVNKAFGTERRRTGQFYFLKPDRIRWDYREIPGRSFVAAQKILWVSEFDENNKLLRILKQRNFDPSRTQLSFLFSRVDDTLKKDFGIKENPEKSGELILTPKSQMDGIKVLRLTLSGDGDQFPGNLNFEDELGNTTEIVFSNIKSFTEKSYRSLPLSERSRIDSLFRFTPPKNVKIVEASDVAKDFQ